MKFLKFYHFYFFETVSYSGLITGLTTGFFGASSVVTLFTDVIRFTPTDPLTVLAEDEVVIVTPVETFGLSGTREVFVFFFDVCLLLPMYHTVTLQEYICL